MKKVCYMVCSGIDIGHFWDVKVCNTLKEARAYAADLPEIPNGAERPYHIERWEWKDARSYLGTEAASRIVERNY
jgi:hypothetical protein